VSTITLQINEATVTGKEGITILELAQQLGIRIPTLCHDDHLSRTGACRICLVEEEKRGVLLPSCVTAIAPGMVIKTDSQRVIENRRAILQLMLASHPESCIVCDKGNRCQLRALATELGIGTIPLDPMPQYFPTFDINPFFKRDMSKCILCGKCIRGDQELVVEGVLDYVDRGFNARPATFENLPLEQAGCTFCGTCLSLCPTGALSETNLVHLGAISHSTDTICSHCACGCPLTLETETNRIIRATATKINGRQPVLCVKGHFGFNYVHHPERLKFPLVRKNGNLERATWEEALRAVQEGFEKITAQAGPEQIGCIASPQLTNEELFLFQKLARIGLKTPHVDNGSRLTVAPILTSLRQALGQTGASAPFERIHKTGLIWVIGASPTETAPVLGYFIKRAVAQNGTGLLVVDPRKTKLAAKAQLWLNPRPGTDLALIQLMTHHLLNENLWNQGYVYSQTEGYLEWKESVLKQDLRSLERSVGIPYREIQKAAQLLVQAKGVVLVIGSGVSQQIQAFTLMGALLNLMLLTGQWGQENSAIFPVMKESNAQGAWDMGVLPDHLPGYHSLQDSQAVNHFESRWENPIPPGPGLSLLEMISAASQGKLKGLYLAGEDPLGAYPDRHWIAGALDKLDFLVVQDLFLTESALKAQIVLPTQSLFEKKGSLTNLEGRLQTLNRVLNPDKETKSDGEIFALLLQGLTGSPVPSDAEEIFREIQEMVSEYQGTSKKTERGPGPIIKRLGPAKPHSFLIPKIHLDRPAADAEYPFLLLTGSLLPHLGAGTRTAKDWRLQAITPPPQVTISPGDSVQLGVTNGDMVELTSRRGTLQLPVSISEGLSPGVIFLPLPYPDLKVNALLEVFWDPTSKGSVHKCCPVQIKKTGAQA
jgi:formate dehydrogenase (NADP+) alpha subunit